ncbi:hypothetical protein PHLGIDRAFT_121504 [Phlebiopsis gigantea 11061_1 CR5-6]|uniref:Replication factor A protein 3 n=1 Tax=Phlebiopsis gigantea (strain 11061_1 CR5-6) TaxID=745531 RepID=A0A0C3RST6_PHLG1|nr:hypothetical protein PHLGIDRAFT_121504 [Phlebiopsis gigantea 11061_1 CR5-6]
MSQPTHTLVNSARLLDHIGQTVRLTGLVLLRNTEDKELLVKASDDGKVRVALDDVTQIPQSAYAEIVGEVVKSGDALAVQAKHVIETGDMLDLSLVDFVVEAGYNPRLARAW